MSLPLRVIGTAVAAVALLAASAVVAVPDVVVEWAARHSPDVVFSVETEARVVALTIDDGPSEETSEILDLLDAHGARATFFVIGGQVARKPGLARQMVEAGHELGHHMMKDRASAALSDRAFDSSFVAMDRILDDFGGSRLFRPGSGWFDERMVERAAKLGYRTVLGSIYPFDAHLPWSDFQAWYVLRHVKPGGIIVLHEGEGRGVRTAEVLRSVLPRLARGGYRVVTVSELMALEQEAGS